MMYDICIVGSGAGASPIAYELSQAGYKVCMLEKGDVYTEKDFSKDEIAYVRRDIFTPKLTDEYHTIEEFVENKWQKFPTYETGWSFWNGNILGGSSNFMSGFFYRLKPKDFKLASTYGVEKDSNVVDWPISYDDLEPYYTKVESLIGVSGDVTSHKFNEQRSTKNFPYKALQEHPINKQIDKACEELGFTSYKTPRAIISEIKGHRNPCYYSNYCGSYACSSGAKSSARAALIQPALSSNNLTIISNAQVFKLHTNKDKQIEKASYFTKNKTIKEVKAKIFVIACQAVETSRLLLNSKDENFPNGVANNSLNVGKNFLSTGGGFITGTFDKDNSDLNKLLETGLFVNRALMDWYYTKDFKGGLIEILFEHANPIRRANVVSAQANTFLFGKELQDQLHYTFTQTKKLKMEIFTDWTSNDNSFISVDENYKDKYGIPVANIRIGSHTKDMKTSEFLAQKGKQLFEQMNAKDIEVSLSNLPSQNLQAGGCRFGNDPKTSVLNKDCQAHEVSNLYISDGSFMPTGGSVPYTFTIYANSFRIADILKKRLKEV